MVFDIVDLERETQAAVFLRWLETTTMTLTFAVFFEDTMPVVPRGMAGVVLVKNT